MATDTRAAVARPETIPCLTDMLFDKYLKSVPSGADGPNMSDSHRRAVHFFVTFCANYLKTARPESSFVVPDNMGIALTNGDIVLLCPHNASAGDMASSVPAIQI